MSMVDYEEFDAERHMNALLNNIAIMIRVGFSPKDIIDFLNLLALAIFSIYEKSDIDLKGRDFDGFRAQLDYMLKQVSSPGFIKIPQQCEANALRTIEKMMRRILRDTDGTAQAQSE